MLLRPLGCEVAWVCVVVPVWVGGGAMTPVWLRFEAPVDPVSGLCVADAACQVAVDRRHGAVCIGDGTGVVSCRRRVRRRLGAHWVVRAADAGTQPPPHQLTDTCTQPHNSSHFWPRCS